MGVEGLLNPVEEKQNTHDYKKSLTFSRKKNVAHVLIQQVRILSNHSYFRRQQYEKETL